MRGLIANPASASGTVPESWNGVHRNFVGRRNVRIQHACIKGGNRHLSRGVPLSWKRSDHKKETGC